MFKVTQYYTARLYFQHSAIAPLCKRLFTTSSSLMHNTEGSTNSTISSSAAEALAKNKAPTIRRFWRNVSVEEHNGGYVVALDKRPIKTPDGKQVNISKHQRVLAVLIAGEWESQREFLGAHSLPLTSLVCRAIDGLSDKSVCVDVIDKLLKYLKTDSICFHEEFPKALVDLQSEFYQPIIDWARSTYNINLQVTSNIFTLNQKPETMEKMHAVVSGFSPLKLAAFERAVMTAKSFLIGLALVEGQITVEQAAMASQVETNSQTQRWGELENAHDIDNAAMRQILGASACAVITN